MPVLDAPEIEGFQGRPDLLEVRLLGPLEVTVAGQPVHIGSPKQRAVLALLALQAGKVVTSDSLCDLVWDEDQPASPAATLQSLISRLRAAVAAASGGRAGTGRDVLRTREPGWVLEVDPAAVDAARFEALAGSARLHAGRGDARAAATQLVEALDLWRGAALVDVVDAGYLAAQATRLNEARLDAVEDLAEAELALGRPAEARARLQAHVEAHPLRERAWALLMTALYRLGRQAAALRAFHEVRALLRDELGLEPSPQLVDLERKILRHDPELADRRPPVPATAAAPAPPAGHGEFADYSVVVVDDHDFQRRIGVQLLRGLGVGAVADAPGGVEALELLEAGPTPDIIVCDIDMPGMDGIEFVTRVSERNLACAVVIASGLEPNVLRAVETIGQSHGLHVLAALEKPLTARSLRDVLGQYTRLHHERTSGGDRATIAGENLREALERGELTAEFSARVDLTTGGFSSAEVAGLWPRPDGAAIPYSVLVEVASREGLLLAFVESVVGEACLLVDEAARAGLDGDEPVRVAIDVSPLPLADPSLADRLASMVQARGQDPRRFVWEIDEVALARAPAAALSVLTRLRVKGFRLSMCHAGGGPSWTSQLGRVPLSEIKCNRRLAGGATGDPKRFALLEAAMASARDVGVRVVADGCDSQADFDTLLALGASEAQGRFVAEPLPAGGVIAWARGRRW